MGKTLTEIKSEEERERAKAADKKRNQKEKMNKLAAKMSKAQQDIDERRAQNAKKIQNEEKCDKERFIAAGEAEQHTSDDRASKRGEIEKTANELKEYNFSEMENTKTRPCGEWRQGRCERGDGCKFKHAPADHPLFSEYVRKEGHPPESIVHFLNFEGVQ